MYGNYAFFDQHFDLKFPSRSVSSYLKLGNLISALNDELEKEPMLPVTEIIEVGADGFFLVLRLLMSFATRDNMPRTGRHT